MAKVSKRFLDKDIEERIYEVFWEALSSTKSTANTKKFLNSFLSHTEHLMLAKRLGIALMLAKGYTYEEIANTLKVSSSTIMGVVFRHKVGGMGLSPALKKIMRDEKIGSFMDFIEEFLLNFEGPKKYGSYAHGKRVDAGRRLYKSRKKRAAL